MIVTTNPTQSQPFRRLESGLGKKGHTLREPHLDDKVVYAHRETLCFSAWHTWEQCESTATWVLHPWANAQGATLWEKFLCYHNSKHLSYAWSLLSKITLVLEMKTHFSWEGKEIKQPHAQSHTIPQLEKPGSSQAGAVLAPKHWLLSSNKLCANSGAEVAEGAPSVLKCISPPP
jgi:hypothetical protein